MSQAWIGDDMAKGGTLTPKQAVFASLVAKGETYTEAYVKAYDHNGSTRQVAQNEGSKMMKKPHIKTRVQELKEQKITARKDQDALSKEWIISKLKAEASDEDNASSVRVRALEILAKTEKLFSDSTTVTVEHRSSDEIEKELKEKLESILGTKDSDITLVS
jgi:phage terminase small subunit